MRLALFLIAAVAGQQAYAQVTYPPVDMSGVSQKATDALAAANAAQATAANACQPMAQVPSVEVVGGAAGSGTACRLVNAIQPRITRSGLFTVGANGNLTCSGSTTCTWSTPLPAGAASYPMFFTAIGTAAAPSIRCKVLTSTNTGFSAQCTQAVATVSVLGASVELLATSGTQVFALALPSTQ